MNSFIFSRYLEFIDTVSTDLLAVFRLKLKLASSSYALNKSSAGGKNAIELIVLKVKFNIHIYEF